MEWIGLKPGKLPRPGVFNLRRPITSESIREAWDHFNAHYKNLPDIRTEDLIRRANEQRQHWVAHESIDVWNAAFAGISSEQDIEEWVRIALVFDAIHKLDPPPASARDYYSELVSQSFFINNRMVRNLSKFRLAKRLWDRAYGGLPADKPARLLAAHQAMQIKNNADFLDGDLVHLGVLGYEDEHSRRRPISCMTCDPAEKLIVRLGVYRGLVQLALRLYPDRAAEHGFPSDCETCFNGDVYCFASSGVLVRHIDVRQHTCPIGFLRSP